MDERTIKALSRFKASLFFNRRQAKDLVLSESLRDDEIYELTPLFPTWIPNVALNGDDLVVDPIDEELYRVIPGQGHTSQTGWEPSRTPALFVRVRNVGGSIDLWVQPTGAHDAYNVGDLVYWPEEGGQVWRSRIDANTTQPDDDVPHNRYWEPID